MTTSDQPEPFPPPAVYAQALHATISRVSAMRTAAKASFMDSQGKQDVQNVIQAYFKEWLKSTNNLREVHDLTRLERAHAREVARSGRHRRRSSRPHGERVERTAAAAEATSAERNAAAS